MSSEERIVRLRTPAVIAKELDVSVWRVLYLLRTRKIKPIAMAGRYRLYDRDTVLWVARLIGRIDDGCGDETLSPKEGDSATIVHSVGTIAEALGVSRGKVCRVIRSLGVHPDGLVGRYRLYGIPKARAIADAVLRSSRGKGGTP